MARQCHLNSCPTGIATQRPELRKKFKRDAGAGDRLLHLRGRRSAPDFSPQMGFRSIEEIVGRADLLERVDRPETPRAQMLDLSMLLRQPARRKRGARRPFAAQRASGDRVAGRRRSWRTWSPAWRPAGLPSKVRDDRQSSPDRGCPHRGPHRRTQTATPACPAGIGAAAVPRQRGPELRRVLLPGMHLELEGEANDYVGKGCVAATSPSGLRRAAYVPREPP